MLQKRPDSRLNLLHPLASSGGSVSLSSAPRTLSINGGPIYPAMNRWAIFGRPLRGLNSCSLNLRAYKKTFADQSTAALLLQNSRRAVRLANALIQMSFRRSHGHHSSF